MSAPRLNDPSSNPYAAPRTYAAGSARVMLLFVLCAVADALGYVKNVQALGELIVIVGILATIVAHTGIRVRLTIQRGHDMGWPGATCTICAICVFIPVAVLIWVFATGMRDANLYGPPHARRQA